MRAVEEELISVIVPVYNVEKYLPACLDSLVAQTYRNLEVILVDDGATDSSGKICDEYAQKDPRFQVIHKANAGVAMARNSGLDRATGAYVSFVDSDDWLENNTYQVLYQGLKQYQAECSVGRCVHVVDDGKGLTYEDRKACSVWCCDSREAMKHVLLGGSAIWNRLFKREIFDAVRFRKDRVNDDEAAALYAYERCSRVVFLSQYTYFYRLRKNSISTASFSLRHLDFYYNTKDNLAFIEKTAPELTPYAQRRMINALLYCYMKMRLKRGKSQEEKRKAVWMFEEIRRYKGVAFANPQCGLRTKLAMAVFSVAYGGRKHG